MSAINLFWRCFFLGMFVLLMNNGSAQVTKGTMGDIHPDPSKGIIFLSTQSQGSLFINGIYLMELEEGDSIHLTNVEPGNLTIEFVSDSLELALDLKVKAGKVSNILVSGNGMFIQDTKMPWYIEKEKITGHSKKLYAIRSRTFYNLNQISLFGLKITSANYYGPQVKGGSFNTICTINGYQFTPAACLGIGIAYANYDVPVSGGYYPDENIGNVSFMPVFVDFRTHLPIKYPVPFFKLNVGYNILLTKHGTFVDMYNYKTYHEMYSGGIIVSPGFGLRILATDKMMITTALEYSYRGSKIRERYDSQELYPAEYIYSRGMNMIQFTLGIGFQH